MFKKTIRKLLSSLSSLLFVIVIVIVIAITATAVMAFTGPSQDPPTEDPDFWQKSGTDMYYDSGNVGIGTASPGAKLEVEQNLDNTNTGVIIDNIDQHLRLTSFYQAGVAQSSSIQSINDAGTIAQDLLLNPGGGNVGIGTTTPNYELEVSGTIKGDAVLNPTYAP